MPAVDALLKSAVESGEAPGVVAVVGHKGKVIYRKAFGSRSLEPVREAMTADTIFDLASLTKPIVTATAVMQLEQMGKLRLNDPVARYLPEFAKNGKQEVTIRQLLTHFSGLREDLDLSQPWQGRDEGAHRAMEERLLAPSGSEFRYSDVNFIVLGLLVEKISGMSLQRYAEEKIFRPLGMTATRYLPPEDWRARNAPTEHDERGVMLRGVVHDPTARRMGGVAGHAGVFSTAGDLARFAQAMLDGRLLAPQVVLKMTTPQQPATAAVLRGLGWDLDSPFSSNRGELLPLGSYGHTGFTGTSLWIDPASQSYIILLSNSVHPRMGKSVVALRARLATVVAAELGLKADDARGLAITGYSETMTASRRMASRNGHVLTGIDVLEADGMKALRGPGEHSRRTGLLTNQTGVDAQGRRTIDVLAAAAGVQLAVIFSPEHGALGEADTADVGDSKDAATGVKIVSVYGAREEQRRPSVEALKELDAVVVDLQDAGARFYTYETTLGYFLEAAAQAGIEVVVLDRPNPITGSIVQGPTSDAKQDFNNYHPLPLRHGMTMGELARLFNAEHNGGIHARLTVVPMQGWLRGDWYDATGLVWINPSPNLRRLSEATLYPGVALVERTNISVGRGTDTPFEVLGAPWIDAVALAETLNRRNISGVRFVPIHFTPASATYASQVCNGVSILVTDRAALDAPELGIELASALHNLYPAEFKMEQMQTLLANPEVYQALVRGDDPRRIADEWREELDAFLKRRAPFLLYK